MVEVSPTAVPPVCRVLDHGKFLYLEKKKAQESRRRQSVILVKEVKVRSRTDEHDVGVKVGHMRRFLDKGQRVKVTVFFRGREIAHPELGKDMLRRVYEKVQDIAQMEGEPRLDGRRMSMMVVPK